MVERESQHYLPQMYLRGFLDPEQVAKGQNVLWRYRPRQKPHARGTSVVAAESLFYNVAELSGTEDEAERALAEMESQAASRLEKLRAGSIRLTAQEKSEFSTYIAIQLTRTPFFSEITNRGAISLYMQAIQKTLTEPNGVENLVAAVENLDGGKIDPAVARGALEAVVAGDVVITQQSTGWNVRKMFEAALDIDEVFEQLHWQLLEAPQGSAFITSDNPVLIIDRKAFLRGPKGFRFSDQMQFQFPISLRFLLTGVFIPGRPDERVLLDDRWVRNFNRNQMGRAQKEIYAPFCSEELQAEFDQIFEERPPLIPELPKGLLD